VIRKRYWATDFSCSSRRALRACRLDFDTPLSASLSLLLFYNHRSLLVPIRGYHLIYKPDNGDFKTHLRRVPQKEDAKLIFFVGSGVFVLVSELNFKFYLDNLTSTLLSSFD